MIQIDERIFQMGWNHQLLVEDVHFYMTTWVVEHIFTSIEFWKSKKSKKQLGILTDSGFLRSLQGSR